LAKFVEKDYKVIPVAEYVWIVPKSGMGRNQFHGCAWRPLYRRRNFRVKQQEYVYV